MTSFQKKPASRRPMPKPPTEARNKPARLTDRAEGFHGRKRKKVAKKRK